MLLEKIILTRGGGAKTAPSLKLNGWSLKDV